MSNDLIPVAYALTETASYMEAMQATREFANVSTSAAAILVDNEKRAVDHYAALWTVLRGMDPHPWTDSQATLTNRAVVDARAYLAEHLDELGEFTERIENRIEEARHGHQVR